IAEGYGFVKYFAEHKKRLVSAVNIDRPLFESLVSQYEWKPAEPKETKKAGKATKTKQKQTAIEETPSIDPALLAQFLQFQKMLKKYAIKRPIKRGQTGALFLCANRPSLVPSPTNHISGDLRKDKFNPYHTTIYPSD